MKIKKATFQQMVESFPKVPPENGGILGAKNGIICKYIHDNSMQSIEQAIYIPNTMFLNECIELWERESILFAGLIHSHMESAPTLSIGDIEYIERIMKNISDINSEKRIFFPIILPNCCVISYAAKLIGNEVVIENDKIDMIDD